MLDTPQIKQTVTQQTAVIHLTIPRAEIRSVMRPGLDELMKAIADQRITATGPWFNHHLRMSPREFDFEISVPVSASIVAVGRVRPSHLPAATVAQTVYRGAYEGLGAAWAEFDGWLRENGHVPSENLWESYLAGPESGPDPTQWRTELSRPLLPSA